MTNPPYPFGFLDELVSIHFGNPIFAVLFAVGATDINVGPLTGQNVATVSIAATGTPLPVDKIINGMTPVPAFGKPLMGIWGGPAKIYSFAGQGGPVYSTTNFVGFQLSSLKPTAGSVFDFTVTFSSIGGVQGGYYGATLFTVKNLKTVSLASTVAFPEEEAVNFTATKGSGMWEFVNAMKPDNTVSYDYQSTQVLTPPPTPLGPYPITVTGTIDLDSGAVTLR